jgi:hypothetical protein
VADQTGGSVRFSRVAAGVQTAAGRAAGPQTGSMARREAVATRHSGAVAELSRQMLPDGAGAEHEQDAVEPSCIPRAFSAE